MTNQNIGFYRRAELKQITGISDSTQQRLEKEGLFPKRRQLAPRIVGWLRTEVDDWVSTRETV